MTLLVLAYLDGVLTIISPCIMPVFPFAFARGDLRIAVVGGNDGDLCRGCDTGRRPINSPFWLTLIFPQSVETGAPTDDAEATTRARIQSLMLGARRDPCGRNYH
jgi:hypothetical protein